MSSQHYACPKCGYTRQDGDAAPAWQCPACGVAYEKYLQLQQANQASTTVSEPPPASLPPTHFMLDKGGDQDESGDDGTWWQKALGAIGLVLGYYVGIHLLIPCLSIAAAAWLLKTYGAPDKRYLIPAIAVQAGQLIWLGIALLALGKLNADMLDIVLLGGCLAWLYANPSLAPLYWLGALQSLAMLINSSRLMDTEIGQADHKALLVHIVLRVLAMGLIVQLLPKVPNGDKREQDPGSLG